MTETILKKGINIHPKLTLVKTSPWTRVLTLDLLRKRTLLRRFLRRPMVMPRRSWAKW